MFVFLICILTLQRVHSACDVQDVCPENKVVQDEIADQHNAHRRAVNPSASDMLMMNYDDEVALSAQTWVDKCILGHGAPSTRMLNGYGLGENLFYSSKLFSWTDVIKAWHSEVSHYRYPNGSTNGKSIGHYTQVVWNSSFRVGCGMKLCDNSIYFYGCHYYRAGNFWLWRPYTAGPPCASCPRACVDKLCTNPCLYLNEFINCPALKTTFGCKEWVVLLCPASCKCIDKIIPIG